MNVREKHDTAADCKIESSSGGQFRIKAALIRIGISTTPKFTEPGGEHDLLGVDFRLFDRGTGYKICVDSKRRKPGCSRYWKRGGPELALETLSNVQADVIGWTLKDESMTDFVLYHFHESDSSMVYLVPFRPLRKFFRDGLARGEGKLRCFEYDGVSYERTIQLNNGHKSECVFVPAPVVIAGVTKLTGCAPVEVEHGVIACWSLADRDLDCDRCLRDW